VSEARLILTCGLPGAGKTTLATQLAAGRSAVRLTKDEWLWALGSTPWDEPIREKVELELWRLAQEILSLGVSVVLDFGLWARIERDEMRSAARDLGVGVELHYLDVPADELWRRIEARNSEPPWASYPIRRADFDGWLRVFEAPGAAELALFDPPPTSN
jgi:predicted kinase